MEKNDIILKNILPPVFFKLGRILPLIKEKTFYKKIIFKDELKKQIFEIPEISKLFSEEKIQQIYVTQNLRNTEDNPDIYITQIRYFWYYQFFKNNYPDIFEKDTTALDVGGASGIFLDSIDKKGTVLDTSEETIKFLKKKGIKAIHGNAECIDLPDKSFDYVVAFQCLEHMLNPVMALNEFGRIAKKGVFISIPYTQKTIIYDLDYGNKLRKESWNSDEKVKIGDSHVFEFSTNDLKKLVSFSNLDYENNYPILYFDNHTSYRKFYNSYYGSYFNFFVFKPKN